MKDLSFIIKEMKNISIKEKKKTGFLIGNTVKKEEGEMYFTPLRSFSNIVIAGAIVYSDPAALNLINHIDGKVDYIFVDVEKKIYRTDSKDLPNTERVVRENVKKSKILVYKANDISVEAVDSFISFMSSDSLRGLGGKNISIIGAGNIGSKLALKLCERGAKVTISRRSQKKLTTICKAINIIKPQSTEVKVKGILDPEKAANNAEILIGATDGSPVISAKMITNLKNNAIVMDLGKGTLTDAAIEACAKKSIEVYRLDVFSALAGMLESQLTLEKSVNQKMGRRKVEGFRLVAGGILGREGEMVVDDISKPKALYGIADGKGDLIRVLSEKEKNKIGKLSKILFDLD